MGVASIRASRPFVLVLVALGVACGPSIHDDDGASGASAGSDTTAEDTTVGLDDAADEGTCRELVSCAPFELEVTGFCRAIAYTWDGTDCVAVSGCECTGPDCCHLAATREACLRSVAATCD